MVHRDPIQSPQFKAEEKQKEIHGRTRLKRKSPALISFLFTQEETSWLWRSSIYRKVSPCARGTLWESKVTRTTMQKVAWQLGKWARGVLPSADPFYPSFWCPHPQASSRGTPNAPFSGSVPGGHLFEFISLPALEEHLTRFG